MRYLLMIALLTGCSSDPEDTPEVECSQDGADRTGTYLISQTERSGGTCGAVPDTVARLDAIPEGCTVTFERWDGCTVERSLGCESAADDLLTIGTGITTQTETDGSRIDGVATLTGKVLSTGEVICVSTYDVVATRQ